MGRHVELQECCEWSFEDGSPEPEVFPGNSVAKNLPANAGDTGDLGLIPGSGRSPGGGNGNPLQNSCLEKSHGQRSVACYSPRGHKEPDTT